MKHLIIIVITLMFTLSGCTSKTTNIDVDLIAREHLSVENTSAQNTDETTSFPYQEVGNLEEYVLPNDITLLSTRIYPKVYGAENQQLYLLEYSNGSLVKVLMQEEEVVYVEMVE